MKNLRSSMPRVALIIFSIILFANQAVSGPENVSPLLRKYTHPHLKHAPDPVRKMAGYERFSSNALGIRCLIQGDITREALEAAGVTITTQAGTVFSAYIPPNRILPVSDLPGIIRIEAARRTHPCLNVSVPLSRIAPNVHGALIPPYPPGFNTGLGVIVGIVDTGVDVDHLDFYDEGGSSRILYLWDQEMTGDPPEGYTYGTEWTQEDINSRLCTSTDTDGHGTHVTGIAAGNGRGVGSETIQYVGCAPEADLIVVKTDFSDADILDGVDYIFDKAALLGKPAVVNNSYGGHTGPHDGTDPFDVALDDLTGPGKIIVTSAGDEGDSLVHSQLIIPSSGSPSADSIIFNVDPFSPNAGTENDYADFTGWYEGTDDYNVRVVSPSGIAVGPVYKGDLTSVEIPGEGAVYIENGITAPSNGDVEVYISLFDLSESNPPSPGTWIFELSRVTSTESLIHFWYFDGTLPGILDGDSRYTVGSPATALKTISVGSYTTQTQWIDIDGNPQQWSYSSPWGHLSYFSSRGPTRDGRIAPDLCAPGTVISSLSTSSSSITRNRILPDGTHCILQGTSMSAPHGTGLAALLLAINPSYTPDDIRSLLTASARMDEYTGWSLPDNNWGYGKMDAECADVIPPSDTLVYPNGGESFTEGQLIEIEWIAVDNFEVQSIDLEYSIDNGGTWTPIAAGIPNDSIFPWTVPSYPTDSALVRVTAYDNKSNRRTDECDSLFSITSVTGSNGRMPIAFSLMQNWPNPFNPTTVIQYDIPTGRGEVSLVIYDVNGRLIRILVNEVKSAGRYSAVWDGCDASGIEVASGIYFLRLKCGRLTTVRKAVLLR